MENKFSRRSFIATSATAAAAITILPGNVVSGMGHKAPSDKLNIAVVGIGGMGNSNLKAVKATENIVALCDVDWKYAAPVFDANPNAKKYTDWRKMYDELGKSIDGVIVATADHTHCIVASHAIELGKSVYVQKPLTHTVYESRLLTKMAAKYNVATQMGNQGSSQEGVNLTCEWLANGEVGEVTKVEAFTDRPIWPQGLNTPKGQWVPETLNWDLFTGPAKMRPYNEVYTPWNWRGWWAYGTGALGDMACHILHPVFIGLELGYPTKAQGNSTLLLQDCAPTAQSVKLTFPARTAKRAWKGSKKGAQLPQVEVSWYDGGIKPMLPAAWPAGKEPNDSGGCVFFHGTKGILVCGCYGVNPWILRPDGTVYKPENAPKFRRRVETSHEMDWVRAAKETPANRVQTASNFSEAGPFNEMVVMGVLAVRLQTLNKELEWDGPSMKFTNITADEKIKIVIEDAFSIHDGHPTFNRTYTDPVPATEFAAELIKHTYREGWKLPEMPA